ncbi:MAG: cytochrome c biogenesis protein CcsA [Nitriliruptoraceae bacterium]
MTQQDLAAISRVLYAPVTIGLYFTAAFVYLYALTTTVGRARDLRRGRLARRVAAAATIAGLTTHVAHEFARGFAQDRLPLGNMFEVTSMMALVGVAVGVGYLTFARRRSDLNGFVLLAGALILGFAGFMYAEPGPLMPILDTWWRPFHVSLLVSAMGIFTAAFVFHALYLLRDSGDRANPSDDAPGSDDPPHEPLAPGLGGSLADRVDGRDDTLDVAAGATATADAVDTDGALRVDSDVALKAVSAHHAAVRRQVSVWRLVVGTFAGAASVSWVFIVSADSSAAGWGRFMTINLALVAAALVAWWFTPYLPSGATLEGLAHRTIAFAFILWTVGTIAGAMWAEQSWGRFWGWDPKETGALLTWIAYAGYLHARATRGVRGRPAAWIGIAAFVILMGTYLIANYVIVGLHSYAGL